MCLHAFRLDLGNAVGPICLRVWVPICALIEARSVIKVLLAHVSMRTSVDDKIGWSTGNDLRTVELRSACRSLSQAIGRTWYMKTDFASLNRKE